jgi:hypothetical protein
MISSSRSTARYMRRFCRYSARVTPVVISHTDRVASHMSQRYAASRCSGCKDDLLLAQNRVASVGVPKGRSFHEIDFPAKEPAQFLPHLDEIEEAPRGVGGERQQHVHVAIGAEVRTQNRSEERELGDLPPLAELGDPGA